MRIFKMCLVIYCFCYVAVNMSEGITPRGLIEQVLDSHNEDQTTRVLGNRSRSVLIKTPSLSSQNTTRSSRRRSSPRRSSPLTKKATDTVTPRTMVGTCPFHILLPTILNIKSFMCDFLQIDGFLQGHDTVQQSSLKTRTRIQSSPDATARKSLNQSVNRYTIYFSLSLFLEFNITTPRASFLMAIVEVVYSTTLGCQHRTQCD